MRNFKRAVHRMETHLNMEALTQMVAKIEFWAIVCGVCAVLVVVLAVFVALRIFKVI